MKLHCINNDLSWYKFHNTLCYVTFRTVILMNNCCQYFHFFKYSHNQDILVLVVVVFIFLLSPFTNHTITQWIILIIIIKKIYIVWQPPNFSNLYSAVGVRSKQRIQGKFVFMYGWEGKVYEALNVCSIKSL